MLVIGINSDPNTPPFHTKLDLDIDTDSPRKIHDLLSKKANGTTFSHILCVEDDDIVLEIADEDDYDLSDPVIVDDTDTDEDDLDENPDRLHEDGDDTDLEDITDVD
jgi:hypothetical protein